MAVDTQMLLRLVPEPTLLEKHPLAHRPVLVQISEVLSNKLTSAFDTYTNDNFGFRKFFTRLNNFLDLNLLKTSTNKRVILGKEDF